MVKFEIELHVCDIREEIEQGKVEERGVVPERTTTSAATVLIYQPRREEGRVPKEG